MNALQHILNDPWRVFAYDYMTHLVRYLIIAGGAYLIFYICLRRFILGRKIQKAYPGAAQMRREILYSLITFAIFSATAVLTITLQRSGWVKLYFNFDERGWGYFIFSVITLILIHDAWFYWTHRLMHWRPLFRTVHAIHHRSHSPSPWAAFCFHPTEAAIHAIVLPLVALVMPLHLYAVGIWLLYMTLMNVGGHLGFELMPPSFTRNRLLGWHNTTLHHDMHHGSVNCNYGLYFNIWDRLMGTNHGRYHEEFDRLTAGEQDS